MSPCRAHKVAIQSQSCDSIAGTLVAGRLNTFVQLHAQLRQLLLRASQCLVALARFRFGHKRSSSSVAGDSVSRHESDGVPFSSEILASVAIDIDAPLDESLVCDNVLHLGFTTVCAQAHVANDMTRTVCAQANVTKHTRTCTRCL